MTTALPTLDLSLAYSPFPAWTMPVLQFLLSLEYDDFEIDTILGYIGRKRTAVGCPMLSEQHVELVEALIEEARS